MNLTRFFLPVGLLCLCTAPPLTAAPPTGQEPLGTYTIKGVCTVQAQAYVDKAYSDSSRFRLVLRQNPRSPYSCDFTLSTDPAYHYTALYGGVSPLPYGAKKHTTLHAVLHQYDTYEERVTFKNLDLVPYTPNPARPRDASPRYLALKEPVTLTTPSGISITLPAQGDDPLLPTFNSTFNGNANALFLKVETLPDTREVRLQASPLYQKHRKPARIKLECAPPNSLVSYQADNTFKTIAVGLPDLRTATHLERLTLIVRQRVDVQSLPIALKVPIAHSASNESVPQR